MNRLSNYLKLSVGSKIASKLAKCNFRAPILDLSESLSCNVWWLSKRCKHPSKSCEKVLEGVVKWQCYGGYSFMGSVGICSLKMVEYFSCFGFQFYMFLTWVCFLKEAIFGSGHK